MMNGNLNPNNHFNEEDPLNDNELSVNKYFKGFIRNKNIEELIAYDNKLFSEVRNLESEKHVLVTQNYKKFVAATETINTVISLFKLFLYTTVDKIIFSRI
jgi:hypothetical protein